MNVLLSYPIFPTSFWSFEKAVQGIGKKAFMPPLSLVTVAALLPQEWNFRLRDRNIEPVTEDDWEWADMVMLSGMIAQKEDYMAQIQEAKRRDLPVVVGGPYATSLPNDMLAAGADFLVLDEGEYTINLFVEALKRGEASGIFRSKDKPDVTLSPVPRYDLLQLDAYFLMAIQYSRGCPFQCEFCDIIILYGRKPRTKTFSQVEKELDVLFDLGWRGGIFFVDDNFIGNKRTVKPFLENLIEWQTNKGYPFSFTTEASIDMAQDDRLLELMALSKFSTVFIGIETPDTDSLKLTMKHQNNRKPMNESLEKIAKSGLRIMAGFIIGFDDEKKGAGERVFQFATENAIPGVTFSMLQALPGTALWDRLKASGRLLDDANLNQTTLLNFVPTRPIEEIAEEYVDAFWKLYDPKVYLKRVFDHFMLVGQAKVHQDPELRKKLANQHKTDFDLKGVLFGLKMLAKLGFVRSTRFVFWKYLYLMFKKNPGGIGNFLSFAAFMEHFLPYRKMVKKEIQEALQARIDGKVKVLDTNIELSDELTEGVEWYKAS
ncbi:MULTISPECIES: B12-binding domain-containing radical SAM protein [Roseivirga]|uniref:B12-binding domain-containing radical SAM protein n=1 Tax=Roseivirga TaxID=290180 RepID=UPI001B0AB79D|nr:MULTISPECIES: B12-binding domain-containing radical SAM protein [Roseivirga]MBO6662397.1 B12-binding domain-containing radical SAM protein [Roseivirga sp.]MBO6762024.1 B12-binding domain-containing radical SAM protein [Roseivirga sp.]MBO6910039.1 B12-binding domain-containing radical SAM protein [Roseivirga sp.]WPZ10804.1 B12-binding domain-containing radical SAM protein [Roseivirga spongicola]